MEGIAGFVFLGLIGLTLAFWAFITLKWILKTLVIFALFIAAWFLYTSFGNPFLYDFPSSLLGENNASTSRLSQSQQDLMGFLRNHPDSCQGWHLLAKSYKVLGKPIEEKYITQHVRALCPAE